MAEHLSHCILPAPKLKTNGDYATGIMKGAGARCQNFERNSMMIDIIAAGSSRATDKRMCDR